MRSATGLADFEIAQNMLLALDVQKWCTDAPSSMWSKIFNALERASRLALSDAGLLKKC